MSINQERLNQLREQALNLQAEVANVQASMNATEVTGTAADGRVAVTMTAAGQFLSVHLDPHLLEDSTAAEVEETFLAALRDAAGQLQDYATQRTSSISSVLDRLRTS